MSHLDSAVLSRRLRRVSYLVYRCTGLRKLSKQATPVYLTTVEDRGSGHMPTDPVYDGTNLPCRVITRCV